MNGRKKNHLHVRTWKFVSQLLIFPYCVRSQFRAWVHGYRLVAIIFAALVALTSPQQQIHSFLLPCMSYWKGKTEKIIVTGVFTNTGSMINKFFSPVSEQSGFSACLYMFWSFCIYTVQYDQSLLYLSCCISGKQILYGWRSSHWKITS